MGKRKKKEMRLSNYSVYVFQPCNRAIFRRLLAWLNRAQFAITVKAESYDDAIEEACRLALDYGIIEEGFNSCYSIEIESAKFSEHWLSYCTIGGPTF